MASKLKQLDERLCNFFLFDINFIKPELSLQTFEFRAFVSNEGLTSLESNLERMRSLDKSKIELIENHLNQLSKFVEKKHNG